MWASFRVVYFEGSKHSVSFFVCILHASVFHMPFIPISFVPKQMTYSLQEICIAAQVAYFKQCLFYCFFLKPGRTSHDVTLETLRHNFLLNTRHGMQNFYLPWLEELAFLKTTKSSERKFWTFAINYSCHAIQVQCFAYNLTICDWLVVNPIFFWRGSEASF